MSANDVHRPAPDPVDPMTELLQQLLEDENDEHLPYEQLEGLVDRRLPIADERLAQAHIAQCPSCRADLAHLQSIAAQMRQGPSEAVIAFKPRTRSSWTQPIYWLGAAAAGVVAAVLLWPHPSPVRLVDTAHTIVIQPNGTVAGLESVPAEARSAVVSALRAGRLEIPALTDVGNSSGTLLGGTSPPQEILRSPLGVVMDDRPLFEWRGDGDPREYSVHVFDASSREVAQSELLRERRWRPDKPLPRGQVFAWQVIVRADGREQVLPAPPAGEARFRVLDAAAIEQVEATRRASEGSHLVMGVVYAQVGLFRDARRELAAFAAANPNADVPRTLLASLPPEP